MRAIAITILILATAPAFAQQHQLSGRDYFNQWRDAGGVSEVGINPYVCFPDPDAGAPGVFFVINATGAENQDQKELIRDLTEYPYITFLPIESLSVTVSPAALSYLKEGGWLLFSTTYNRGVRTPQGTVAYNWDKDKRKWETRDRFEVDAGKGASGATFRIQILIQAKTLRYARFSHETLKDGSEVLALTSIDTGACEKITDPTEKGTR